MVKKVIITAGGTRENIDPVRYIGNYSSGKMGIALADEAYSLGYDVLLVATVEVSDKPYKIIKVNSADEMLKSLLDIFPNYDVLLMAAAVADYKPVNVEKNKIKKTNKTNLIIELEENKDILKEISKIKKKNQIVIGFCAETENLLENAHQKLLSKKLDFIVANDVSRKDIGFGSDYNEITLISKNNQNVMFNKSTKNEIAKNILKFCIKN